ncbi:MAG: response regulator [Marinisporobacter sp.]|jgi:CheY-like chemotaxis protein|nr:response regulator [Marinisporobacter sp.]
MKVFIIDDFKPYIHFLKKNMPHLMKREDISFYYFDDSIRALQAIKKERPRVIITDMTMPKMDGYRFIEKIREEYDPIIVVVSILRHIKNISVDFKVQKPLVNLAEFINTIDEAIELAKKRMLYEAWNDTDCSLENEKLLKSAIYTLTDAVTKDEKKERLEVDKKNRKVKEFLFNLFKV